jgi:hypothetical protein
MTTIFKTTFYHDEFKIVLEPNTDGRVNKLVTLFAKIAPEIPSGVLFFL